MSLTRDHVVAALLTLVVLVAGIALGVIFTKDTHGRRPPPPNPSRHLTQELSLDDTQAEQVRAIFDALSRDLDALRAEIDPRVRARIDVADEAVRALLRDDQRARFDALQAERRARPPRGPTDGPPPHGPPPHGPPPHGPPPHGSPPHGPPPHGPPPDGPPPDGPPRGPPDGPPPP